MMFGSRLPFQSLPSVCSAESPVLLGTLGPTQVTCSGSFPLAEHEGPCTPAPLGDARHSPVTLLLGAQDTECEVL